MACEANCIHDPGHEYNMEGPPRLFDGEYNMEGPLRFPLPYGPISVRNAGKGMEVENGRRCSRLFIDADQLCESDRGAADDMDLMVGQLCESRNECGVDPARGDLNFWKWDLENAGGDGLGVDARESQEVPASNCGAHGHGYVSESQAVPASSYDVGSLENAVQLQNRQMVESATVTCQNLKFAITRANEMLLSLNKPRSVIPQEMLIDMEIHLGTSIRWLYEQRQEQEKAVEHLLNVKLTLENQIEELIQDKNNLVNQLFEQPKSSHALSAIERRQLELLGINKVSDLINQYRFLLMQMSEMKPDKSRSGLSVSTRKDAVAQPGKAQIPSIVKPQSGTCFSKIGDQHEGRNNKVDEKSEVDRKQAVNVSHKRSSVAFIGYKPKRSRDFKGSPKRSYASVAAAKSSVAAASRSGPSAKAIKQCFVCGEVVHVAKDCPLRFVEKGKVDKVTQQYTVGGIAFEHAKSKDKNDANLELDALPFSACNAVGNDTVKAYVADVPATKKDTDLSENNSMMPLVGDDARHCDIFNCICVNKIEIVLDNVIVSQVKPYVKQKEPLSTVVTNDSSIREKPRQSGKEFRSFCNSSADQFQSTVTSILHQHQLNSQLKDISLNKVLQLESSKSDVLLKYGKQYRPIYDLIL